MLHVANLGSFACKGPERYIIPERLKDIGPRIDDARLFTFLQRHGSPNALLALRLYRAFKSIEQFEAEFLASERPLKTTRHQRSVLPPHIFAEAECKGIIKRLPRRIRPYAAAPLKAVADRKLPGVGRLIYPACATNDMCRAPDPCPLPLLPDLIANVLDRRFGFTVDIRSWFYAFTLDEEVAARYFATYDTRGRPYAHVRGPMGFAHMPTLATCVAQAMVEHATANLSAYGVSWIDDVTIVATTYRDASLARQRFVDICRELNVELRDLTPVSQYLSAVGVDLDLRRRRWRLQPTWCAKALASPSPAHLPMPIDAILTHAGRIAWAAYALQIPFTPFVTCLREAGALAQKLVDRTALGSDLHTLGHDARDAIRRGLTLIRCNPWRKHAAREPTRTVVTDASLTGFGLMFERRGVVVEQSIPSGKACGRSFDHITVREAVALRLAVMHRSHANRTVRCITDNAALYWILRQQRAPRNLAMTTEISRLLRWCYRSRTTLVPMWLRTDNMALYGADAASRVAVPRTATVSSDRLAACVRLAERDTSVLTAGCALPRRSGTTHLPMRLVRAIFP